MSADDWEPGPCKHGAQPIVEREWVSTGASVLFDDVIPGRKTLQYDCPTPYECVRSAYEELWAL